MKHLAVAGLLLAVLASSAAAARLKDIAELEGARTNQLYGLGLVVGLDGTGDGSALTLRAAANLFRRLNLAVEPGDIASANIAAVIVTAELPPFGRAGTTIDVDVNAIGSTTSLQGGTLLMTPLKGADDQVYAVAQGAISVGGFIHSGAAASAQKNHPTVGRIPGGATIEREELSHFVRDRVIAFNLRNPDFATVSRISDAINEKYAGSALSVDAGTVWVRLPETVTMANLAGFITSVGEIDVVVDMPAKVVINERTGTIVAGENVTISTVAISHGNLAIMIRETTQVSQPPPFSPDSATTERTAATDLEVTESSTGLHVVERSTTVHELARALNALGVTSRDLISIFQALKRAGALQAELVIM